MIVGHSPSNWNPKSWSVCMTTNVSCTEELSSKNKIPSPAPAFENHSVSIASIAALFLDRCTQVSSVVITLEKSASHSNWTQIERDAFIPENSSHVQIDVNCMTDMFIWNNHIDSNPIRRSNKMLWTASIFTGV